jgi:hypothetical protein
MEYLAIIYGNTDSNSSQEEWTHFIQTATQSGLFKGGSEVGMERIVFGKKIEGGIGKQVVGYMKFETDDIKTLLELLTIHPTIIHGGTVELLDLPKS